MKIPLCAPDYNSIKHNVQEQTQYEYVYCGMTLPKKKEKKKSRTNRSGIDYNIAKASTL